MSYTYNTFIITIKDQTDELKQNDEGFLYIIFYIYHST